jgi:hypothetical protein
MKFLPTERAMGLVTILSGLAIPVGVLIGVGPLGASTPAVEVFENAMWVVNPLGMGALQLSVGLFSAIGLYILGTMLSALVWGFIDALIFKKK